LKSYFDLGLRKPSYSRMSNEAEGTETPRAIILARAMVSESNGYSNTSGETIDDAKNSFPPSYTDDTNISRTSLSPPGRVESGRSSVDSNGASAAWKRSLPKSAIPNNIQIPADGKRKGPEPVHRSESLTHGDSRDSWDGNEKEDVSTGGGSRASFGGAAPREGADQGMLDYIAKSSNGERSMPLSTIRPSSQRVSTASSNTTTQLSPIIPPATNVDPLAAKAILGAIRRGINPAKEVNIVSTLNIVDNQMAMAGIGTHSRAALFVSLLEDTAQHAVLNKAELASNWEALRGFLVETRNKKVIRNDVMSDFMQCARSMTAGSAESCARLAVEQLELMRPATTARLGVPTFIAAVPDDALRADFHDLYEGSLAALDAESDDESAYTTAFIEAAKMIDRRGRGGSAAATGAAERPLSKRPAHRREGSMGSLMSDRSNARGGTPRRGQSLSNRGGSASFHSVGGQSMGGGRQRLKKSSTRVYDRLTGEETVVERDAPVPNERYFDDNESVASGRSGRSGRNSLGRASTYSSAFDGESKRGSKSIVTVYNYPKDLSLAQLVELTTPPAGRAPVMIRHKDGLIKVLYSNMMAAQEVTQLLNNCTVNSTALGATCETRGGGSGGGGDSISGESRSLARSSTGAPRPLSLNISPLKTLPSFAGRSPSVVAGSSKNGPPPPLPEPVAPAKQSVTEHWDYPTNLFVGTVALLLSALAQGFGNGFEVNSPLAYLHIFLLLCGFEFFNRGMDHAWHGFILSMGIVIITQALGSMLGFAYFFSYPNKTAITVNVTLLFSVILWVTYAFVAVMLEYAYRYKFPDSSSVPFVFPAAHTMITTVVFGDRYGTFFALGNAVTDYAPLRAVAAAFGIGGIHFLAVLIPTLAFLKIIHHEFKPPAKFTVGLYTLAVFGLVCTMGFVEQSDYIYQRSVSESGYRPTVSVSCVTGREYTVDSDGWNAVLETSRLRIVAGDSFVLWSDRTLTVSNDADEAALLVAAQEMVRDFGANSSTYLGISYERIVTSKSVLNLFYLIGPEGIVMEHEKVLPMPFLDDNVIESGSLDFVSENIDGFGRVGVGMGFEMSNPAYMRQAGEDGVDIVLQPLWSHGGLGRRRFDSDSIRAIENGFTLFRCDSQGVSGVIGPKGEVFSKEFVKVEPNRPTIFNLPIRKHVPTFYNAAGYSFDYICVAFTVIFWILAIMPWYFLDAITGLWAKKEERQHNFVIKNGVSGDDFEFADNDGNPFSGVNENTTQLATTQDRDSEEEQEYGEYFHDEV
jgi:apolipoprotein N-acyltransferase